MNINNFRRGKMNKSSVWYLFITGGLLLLLSGLPVSAAQESMPAEVAGVEVSLEEPSTPYEGSGDKGIVLLSIGAFLLAAATHWSYRARKDAERKISELDEFVNSRTCVSADFKVVEELEPALQKIEEIISEKNEALSQLNGETEDQKSKVADAVAALIRRLG